MKVEPYFLNRFADSRFPDFQEMKFRTHYVSFSKPSQINIIRLMS